MHRAIAGLIPPMIAVVVSCAPTPAPVDTGAAQNALREADAAYSKAGNTRDLDGFMAHYASDAVGYPPNEPTVTGVDALRSYLGKFFQDSAFAATFQPVSIEVSSDGTMGYTLNRVELRATGPDGQPASQRVRDLHVWRKEADGSWKLVIDLWNVEP